MRQFDYKKEYVKLLTPDIVALLTAIHEYRGEQGLYIESNKDTLEQLLVIAKIQSTEASNRIEGIVTTNSRLEKIVREKTMPNTRSEKEIAGYRDVLSTIHETYEYIPPRASFILQLHRDLFRYSGQPIGGKYKNSDNMIKEVLPDGTEKVRFQPAPAWETPEAVDKICDAYELALQDGNLDPLILSAMFILDFLCIHPFSDGNGRMSRLLTLLLLYRAGYTVGKYISIEKLIADSKESYYETLEESSRNWHEGSNDYAPFVRYMLGVIVAAYREFTGRAFLLKKGNFTKTARIREIIKNNIGTITKTQIKDQCPDISTVTVQRALAELLEQGEIIKIGGGRYTTYTWNLEKE
ncbi:Fic family protein [Selenomonas sp.]|uniref:Fic family protein n=1 Tax=Selenomonas sp. TaxID=2053611 RepID=UPI0025FF9C18|nr:Fic family protein [Selenomonas sp.]MBQ1867915.1 Fic family protein [Selenomonas sp.]